jgi:hypothetical protein
LISSEEISFEKERKGKTIKVVPALSNGALHADLKILVA